MRDAAVATNPSAPPGKSQRYARPERERRFLLAKRPAGAAERTARIVDRYLVGTRLRLRQMTETHGSSLRTYYKLTQKVPAPEVEFEDDASMNAFVPPPWAVAEVTLDSRFTGGHFSTMQSGDLTDLLSAFGIYPAH